MNILSQVVQAQVFFTLGIVSAFITAFTSLIKFHTEKLKALLIRMELYTVLFLFTIGLSYTYESIPGKTGLMIAVHSVSLLTTCLILYCYNEYLTIIFMRKGYFKKLPALLKAGYIFSSIWAVFLCILPFINLSITVDENNYYEKGPLIYISVIIALIIISLQLIFLVKNRALIGKKLSVFLITASLFFLLASSIQILDFGRFFGHIAVFFVLASLFGFTLMEQNEELQKAAYTDPLTGMSNAYGYIHDIDNKIRQGNITKYDAFYVEADCTGILQNTYGKEKYDEIIHLYQKFISSWINKNELIGILGGNLYVTLIERTRTEEFLRLIADTPIEIDINDEKTIVHVKAVAGGYEIRENIKQGGPVMGKITVAYSYVKNASNLPYIFLDDETERRLKEEKSLIEDIRAGLKKEEFEPFYQPKVDTESYILCGSEALARWRKDNELIPPMKFIPLIERSGLVCTLDFYILEHVCRDMREWIDQGMTPPCVSVNFSRKNLGNPDFAKDIRNTIEKYSISPSLIQIEVTETNDEYPLSALKNAVDSLHDFGFSVAIDDFGTGSSSISLLKEITFDVLKIDKTFIDYKDEKEKKLLSYIIEMSKAIDISVIAEGVEDMNHVMTLKDMDCAHIQGYVFDKPLDKNQYEDRIRKREYVPV